VPSLQRTCISPRHRRVASPPPPPILLKLDCRCQSKVLGESKQLNRFAAPKITRTGPISQNLLPCQQCKAAAKCISKHNILVELHTATPPPFPPFPFSSFPKLPPRIQMLYTTLEYMLRRWAGPAVMRSWTQLLLCLPSWTLDVSS